MRTILQPAERHAVEPAVRFVAALLVVLAAATLARAAEDARPRYRVEIDAPTELAETLRRGLDLVRFEDDAHMSGERLRRLADQAKREAKETAATEGYFSAEAQVSIDEQVQPWRVRLVVRPGERTDVGEVEISFTGPAASDPQARALLKRVRDTWSLRRGAPFRQSDWEEAKRSAVRELSSWRYAAARIAASRALVDPKAHRADLSVQLASGPGYRFGDVRVSGLHRYAPQIAQNLAPFRPGDVYDRDQLFLYQQRLLESGYFVSAQAEVLLDTSTPERAPVRLALIEASRHHVEAGVGYTTDAGPRLDFTYSDQDLAGADWRLRNSVRVDQKTQSAELDFDSPPRPGGRWLSFFGRADQTDIQNQFTREFAAGASYNFGAQPTPSALIVSGHLEEQRVAGDGSDHRAALYFGYRRTFRRTDNLVYPRSGYLGMVELGGAPPGLATRPFVRGVASASLFFPVGRLDDLLLHGEAGRVESSSREGIPSAFLFRTGGDQTVRGYAFESLGVQQGDAIVGGRRYAVGSVEYTHWFADRWGIAAFVDAGNAWDDASILKAAVGYGFGPRFRTPIGPIRADLAYGQQTHDLRLHFSVGYTF